MNGFSNSTHRQQTSEAGCRWAFEQLEYPTGVSPLWEVVRSGVRPERKQDIGKQTTDLAIAIVLTSSKYPAECVNSFGTLKLIN